jgi:hypothetical protein
MVEAGISSKHMEGGERERCAGEPGCTEQLWRAGEGTKITSKSLLYGEPAVMRLDRQVTGVNTTWIWACKLDRLWLQMAKKEEKDP